MKYTMSHIFPKLLVQECIKTTSHIYIFTYLALIRIWMTLRKHYPHIIIQVEASFMFNVHNISHFSRDRARFALMNRPWTSLRQGAHKAKVKSIKQNACVNIALSMTLEEPCKNLSSSTRHVIKLKFSSLPAFEHVRLSNSPHFVVRRSLSWWRVTEINDDLASALMSESAWLSLPVIDIDLDAVKVTFCRKIVYFRGKQAKLIKQELVKKIV